MNRRIRVLSGSAAAVAAMALAGAASADPTSFSGSVANGGCDSAHTVTVNGPSRIDAQVSSTTASPSSESVQILRPDGSVAATDSYDTPGGGNYAIRVCKTFESMDPPTVQYTARYATGPAGKPALPQGQADSAGGVLGATATLTNSVRGSAAVKTRSGLAWFTGRLNARHLGVVKVFDPAHKRQLMYTNTTVKFGTSTVRMSVGGMTLTIDQGGATQHIAFRSPHFKTSGKVVRGAIHVG